MGYERSWERLLEHLATVGDVVEAAPGRTRVTVDVADGSSRVVEIVMTRDDWSGMSSVVWGDVEAAAAYVVDLLRGLPPDEGFLVYDGQYDVQGCATPEIPEDPQETRMRELVKQHPRGIPGGRWITYDRDGNVKSVFGSHPAGEPGCE